MKCLCLLSFPHWLERIGMGPPACRDLLSDSLVPLSWRERG
jgi:hypothetical protein